MTFPAGHLAAVTTVLVAVGVTSGGVAATSQPAPLPELVQLNAIRRQLGLAPLRSDPIAQRVATRMARSDRSDSPPQVLDSQPDCAVCDVFFERGESVDPRALHRKLGGALPVGFGIWRDGWTAADNLSVFFRAAALVLDPRARTFNLARTPLGMIVVAVSADRQAPFRRPVRWPPGPVDPRRQLWVEVLLPPGRGYPHLYDVRGGRNVTVAYPLAVARGFRGSRLVAFGLNTALAYGRAYRVGTSRLGVKLKTRSTPAAFLRRSWAFHSVARAEREAFLDAVRRTPAQLRVLLAELDGAVDVVGSSEACLSADACEQLHGERATVGIATSVSREVIVHELGHVVFDLALDEPGRRAFHSAFIRTGWEKVCCIPLSELFADQLAHWTLGEESGDTDTPGDLRWVSRGEFSRLLRENAGYRPLPVDGLLER